MKPILKTYRQWYKEWEIDPDNLRPEPDQPIVDKKYWYGRLDSSAKVDFKEALSRLTYVYYNTGITAGDRWRSERIKAVLGLQ